MAPQETSDLVQVLENGRSAFNAVAGGVSEAQAERNPAEGRWSVLQCVEHVTIVEERFLGFLESAGRLESPAVDGSKEARLYEQVTNRSGRAEAPDVVRPTGRFASLADALAGFNAVRARTILFAAERTAELPALACEHRRFGPVNGREMLMIIAGHAVRHAAQIGEVRAQIGA